MSRTHPVSRAKFVVELKPMAKAKDSRGNKHYEPFLFLMFITILVITGFQFYWLKNTYDREKRTMFYPANFPNQAATKLEDGQSYTYRLHPGALLVKLLL